MFVRQPTKNAIQNDVLTVELTTENPTNRKGICARFCCMYECVNEQGKGGKFDIVVDQCSKSIMINNTANVKEALLNI